MEAPLIATAEVRCPPGFVELYNIFDMYDAGFAENVDVTAPEGFDLDDLLVCRDNFDALCDFCEEAAAAAKIDRISVDYKSDQAVSIKLCSASDSKVFVFAEGTWKYANGPH